MSDLISRKGVSAWLDNMGYAKLADAVMDEDRFPSADKTENGWHVIDYLYQCNNCGWRDYVIDPPKCCPNCGEKIFPLMERRY